MKLVKRMYKEFIVGQFVKIVAGKDFELVPNGIGAFCHLSSDKGKGYRNDAFQMFAEQKGTDMAVSIAFTRPYNAADLGERYKQGEFS